MDHNEVRTWFLSRSTTTRRFVQIGMAAWVASLVIVSVQFLVWQANGWGSANFLPGWFVGIIWVMASMSALPCFYYVLAYSARFGGKVKWGAAGIVWVLATALVAAASGHSLPQLSTLIISSQQDALLKVYHSKWKPPGSYRRRGEACRNNIRFGPLYALKGGWCGVSLSSGKTYRFQGHGNAVAIRLQSVQR